MSALLYAFPRQLPSTALYRARCLSLLTTARRQAAGKLPTSSSCPCRGHHSGHLGCGRVRLAPGPKNVSGNFAMKGSPRMKKLGGPLGSGLWRGMLGWKTAAQTGGTSGLPVLLVFHCASRHAFRDQGIFQCPKPTSSFPLGPVLQTMEYRELLVRIGLHAAASLSHTWIAACDAGSHEALFILQVTACAPPGRCSQQVPGCRLCPAAAHTPA